MPYLITHPSANCWSVVNAVTGRVYSKCTTEAKANRQKKLLEGVEAMKKKTKKTKKSKK